MSADDTPRRDAAAPDTAETRRHTAAGALHPAATRRLDVPALVAGLVVLALGGVLLLDRLDALTLSFGVLAPACLAAAGAILLATGLDNRGRETAAPATLQEP